MVFRGSRFSMPAGVEGDFVQAVMTDGFHDFPMLFMFDAFNDM